MTKESQQKSHASFCSEDIQKLQDIHLKKTGVLLTTQEAIEMGIRITELLKVIAKPI